LLERPISETRLGVSLDHGTGPLDPKKFYVHHPPLIVWAMTGAYKLFGVSETVGRLVPAAASVFGSCCLAALAFQLGGRSAAILALVFYLAMPLQTYYGKMPNHEPLGHAFMLAACLAASRYRRNPSTLALCGCATAVFLACWSCWIAYIFALALGWTALHDDRRPLFYAAGFSSAAALATVLLHIRWVRDDGLIDLLAAFFVRSAETPLLQWSLTVGGFLAHMLTPATAGAAVFALVTLPRAFAGQTRAIAPLIVAGWTNILLFRQGAFVHEYYCLYLGGALALYSAAAFAQLSASQRQILAILLISTCGYGVLELVRLHAQQSKLYASDVPESERFVVVLGAAIAERFPTDARILCDAAPIGEHLGFYANRRIVHYGEQTAESLPKALADADGLVFNTGLERHAQTLERVLALAKERVVTTNKFTVEKHTFTAVALQRGQ
jgi:4-amino-4-deoxy-L-arabinose transferase-like glycosyltransferase